MPREVTSNITLEVGKFYITRDGQAVFRAESIVNALDPRNAIMRVEPVGNPSGMYYTSPRWINGLHNRNFENPSDLVAEVPDPALAPVNAVNSDPPTESVGQMLSFSPPPVVQSAPFYIVYSPQGSTAPRMRHASYDLANREAMRLARAHVGHEFYVMKPEAKHTTTATLSSIRF